MAVFEKDRGSRRYYITGVEEFPAIEETNGGNIPAGSLATVVNQGAGFCGVV